jgi:TolA-binding protein
MSELVRPRPEPEDLSALVRRGSTSRTDERDLQRALERDPTLRVAHRVGLDFDLDASVRAGDEELIVRAADAALRRMAPASASARRVAGSRSWQMVAGLVAAVVLSCSGVGAALWVAGVTPPWRKPATTMLVLPRREPRKHAARPHVQPPTQGAPTNQIGSETTSEPALATLEAPAPSVPTGPTRHTRGPDAAALFRAANLARRAGELSRAKRLYAALIQQAPTADEALLAHVSLGKLLLAQGHFAAAEREFARYLRAGGGPLSEEALFSRAYSLERLGRVADERDAFRALLSAFPDSVYAARAKERLAAADFNSRAEDPRTPTQTSSTIHP